MPRELDDVIEEEIAAYVRGFKEGYQSGLLAGISSMTDFPKLTKRCDPCSGTGMAMNKEAEWETCLWCGGKGVQ